jgi:hypothetical protein
MTDCDLIYLDQEDVNEVAERHPELKERLVRFAKLGMAKGKKRSQVAEDWVRLDRPPVKRWHSDSSLLSDSIAFMWSHKISRQFSTPACVDAVLCCVCCCDRRKSILTASRATEDRTR